MNSQILIKIKNFVKNRLIELCGTLLALISIFLLISIATYSPSDPNFIYTPENLEIKNFGGFYGSVIADFLLQSIGLVSFFVVLNLFYWGLKLINNKKISNFIQKIFFTLIYIISSTTFINVFYNDSFWLIDSGNGGFVGQIIKENIYVFSSFIENQYVGFVLLFVSILFFILSLGLKIREIYIILLSPYLLFKKIFIFLKSKNKTDKNLDSLGSNIDSDSIAKNISKEHQPILPFSTKKTVKSQENDFILPPISFLEKKS